VNTNDNVNTISHPQRKLYRAILRDIQNSKRDFIVNLGGAITALPLYKLPQESIHDLLKHMNLDYPRDKQGKVASTAAGQISSKHMTDHIKWLELCCIESHIEMLHYEEETKRLMNLSGIV
jgi:hypothetical protein